MKSSKRLVDILDEELPNKTFWDKMFTKMSLLLAHIEKAKGPSMSMDDKEWRWVQDRIEYWESEERLLTPEEMGVANHYWKKYGS